MIIVMGATGFVGMYTVERLLKAGKEVLATGRNGKLGALLEKAGARFVTLDITNTSDFDKLPTEGVEGVILLAGLLPANAKVNLDVDENAVIMWLLISLHILLLQLLLLFRCRRRMAQGLRN